MHKVLMRLLPSLLLGASSLATAEEPKPAFTLSSNAYLVSDYLYRGQTQTWGKPAIQAGFDLSHASGLYLGTWASNVSGNQFAGGSLEIDLYGGYNGKISDDIGYSAGFLYYYYPGANYNKISGCTTCIDEKYDTLEANVGGNWKWVSGKLSYAITDYFGLNQNTAGLNSDSKGTVYLEGNANYPLMEGLTLVGHIGYTNFSEESAAPVNGETNLSFADWKLGLSYTMKDGWTAGAYYVDTTNKDFWKNAASVANSDRKDLNRSTLYITFGRTF
ncbi:MAG: TorF family putative porin [Burkholderiales bacterium]